MSTVGEPDFSRLRGYRSPCRLMNSLMEGCPNTIDRESSRPGDILRLQQQPRHLVRRQRQATADRSTTDRSTADRPTVDRRGIEVGQ